MACSDAAPDAVRDGAALLAQVSRDEHGDLRVEHWNGTSPGGTVLGRLQASGPARVRYYVTDHLGSTRAVIDGNGTVQETRDYYPYGLRLPGRTTAEATPALEDYTGHERDSETGLHYAGARYYMSALGRWTTVDPLADAFPGYSPYNYVENNSTNLTDPTGLFAESRPSTLSTRYYDEDGSLIYDDGIDNGLEVYTSWGVIRDHISEGGVDWDGVRNDPGSNPQVVDQGKYWGWVGAVRQDLMNKYDGGVRVTSDNKGNISYQTTNEAIWSFLFTSAASLAGEWVLLKTTGAILRATSKGRVRSAERLLREWLGDDYRVITNSSGDPIFMSKDGTKSSV